MHTAVFHKSVTAAPPIAVTPWLLGGHKGVTAMGVGWIPMRQRDYIYHWNHHTSMRGVLSTVHFFELWHVQHIWMCFVCYKAPSRDFQRPTSPGFHFSNGQRFQFPGWGLGPRDTHSLLKMTIRGRLKIHNMTTEETWSNHQERSFGRWFRGISQCEGIGGLKERRHRHRCLKFLPLWRHLSLDLPYQNPLDVRSWYASPNMSGTNMNKPYPLVI